MSSDIIQAEYEALAQLAQRFERERTATSALQQRLVRDMARVGQSWQGQGSDAFQAEMRGELLPAIQRLAAALGEAGRTTRAISATLRQGELEAEALFKGRGEATAPATGGGGGLWGSIGEWVHGGLDVLGLVPGFGEVADGINGAIYLAEGRHLEAGLSFAAMIPFAGWGATAGKLGLRVGREVIEEGAERLVREGVEEGAERLAREGVEEGVERGARDLADPPATVTVASGHKSVQDPTFLRYGELPPNSTFSRNGYEYATDAEGRVVQASGQLRLEEVPRYRDYETQVGRMGLPDDQGGHIIGNRFGGTSEGVNLVPQDGNFNMGRYNQLERQWAKEIDAGNTVEVDIQLVYDPGSNRPSRYIIEYIVTNPRTGEVIPRVREFDNLPGGGA